MKPFFKITNIFLSLILLAVAILVGLLAFPIFGNQALIVRSGSMQPTIDIGSVIVARPSVSYSKGDIIAFRSQNNSKTIISHRVTAIGQDQNGMYYTTKGDANKTVDGWEVRPSQIIGKSFITLPYAGKVLIFARSDVGLPLLIIIPAIVVIFFEGFTIFKEIRKNRKPIDELDMTRASTRKSSGFAIKIALVSGVFLIIGGVVGSTFAFQSDSETSQQNVFQAAASFGTPTPSITITPTVSPTITPTPGVATTLVVNEFLWDTTCGNNASQRAANFWIELFNGSNATVDLKDWRFTDANNNIVQISNAVKLVDPGEYIVITKDGSVFNSCFTLQGTPETANLGGNTDFLPTTTNGVLSLEMPDGNGGFIVVDKVEYGPILNAGVLNTSSQQSISRNPNGFDSALGNTFNTTDFIVNNSVSPGVAN